MDVDAKIIQINAKLKIANTGVTLEKIGNRLYLKATLPPKPGKTKRSQQRIALKLYANLDGIKRAEAEAKKLGALLALKEFDWSDYLAAEAPPEILTNNTIAKLIEDFERNYFIRRKKNNKSLTTWRGDYLLVLRRLPPEQSLTEEILINTIKQTTPDTKTRKRTCMVLAAIAKFAGLESSTIDNIRSYSGQYSPFHVAPRDIPSDELIALWFHKIESPAWRWVYGMAATYGLRNHEIFRLDLNRLRHGSYIVSVLQGKTGSRLVWPCYPEWVDEFDLFNVQLPPLSLDRSNSSIGGQCSHYFHSINLPFGLYDLRHAWAIRTLEFGLDITLAAQQMGHSVAVHTQLYHRWISEKHHQRAFELLMKRENRPRCPKINT